MAKEKSRREKVYPTFEFILFSLRSKADETQLTANLKA